METLIPMTDFVLEQRMTRDQIDAASFLDIQNHISNYYSKVFNYANFLKKPLKLGYFVPCYIRDGIEIPYTENTEIASLELFKEFEEAKERVIFDGCKYIGENEDNYFIRIKGFDKNDTEYCYYDFSNVSKKGTIEQWIGLELTETAKREIGLI